MLAIEADRAGVPTSAPAQTVYLDKKVSSVVYLLYGHVNGAGIGNKVDG